MRKGDSGRDRDVQKRNPITEAPFFIPGFPAYLPRGAADVSLFTRKGEMTTCQLLVSHTEGDGPRREEMPARERGKGLPSWITNVVPFPGDRQEGTVGREERTKIFIRWIKEVQ